MLEVVNHCVYTSCRFWHGGKIYFGGKSQMLVTIFCLLHLLAANVVWVKGEKCPGGIVRITPDSGRPKVFESPNWPSNYPENYRCRYEFVGRPNQRVQIHFDSFNVEGLGPSCKKDFLDIYIEMKTTQDSLTKSPMLGRFCGHRQQQVPNNLISRRNILVMDLYSDKDTQTTYYKKGHREGVLGFNGTYSFISAERFRFGTLLPNAVDPNCSFLVNSADQPMVGNISSPTYPGLYPDKMNCTIVFRGASKERVRLEFEVFDLHRLLGFGVVTSCPVDRLRILDGDRWDSPLITEQCGQQKNLVIFSTKNTLRVEFVTHTGRIRANKLDKDSEELQRKGFLAQYTFSKDFVKLGQNKWHILGTECDLWVRSEGPNRVVPIGSPGFTITSMKNYPLNRTCTYYLYGIHNSQERERVEVDFDIFDIPKSSAECSNGFLRVYKSAENYLNPTKPADFELCGTQTKDDRIQRLVSRGSQMVLLFNTQHATVKGQGFLANITFKKDFQIEGTMTKPGECEYIYSSKNIKEGYINSPFYPDKYPLNITCRYIFRSLPSEYIRIQFQKFYVAKKDLDVGDDTIKKHHSAGMGGNCSADYVEIIEVVQNPVTRRTEKHNILRYCGIGIPGPHVSDPRSSETILIFHSNKKRASTGFLAYFDFVDKLQIRGDCGGNVTNSLRGGILTSPNFPRRYPSNMVCEWHLRSSNLKNRLMLQFDEFEIEGSPRSCSMAILRIYIGNQVKPASELCGSDSSIPSFINVSPYIRIRFLVSKVSRGAKGFRLSWTEILTSTSTGVCEGFRCKSTKYCIDHRLECNNYPNCGSFTKKMADGTNVQKRDRSDEQIHSGSCPNKTAQTGRKHDAYNMLHVGIGVILTILFLFGLVIGILYKEHRKTSVKKQHGHTANGQPYGQDSQVTRQLMYDSRADEVGNGHHSHHTQLHHHHLTSFSHGGDTNSHGGTLTREKMQKISIV